MNLPENGTEHQTSTSIAARSRPPPVAKKPKPSLPQKPAVARRPELIKKLSQNGEEPDITAPTPISTAKPPLIKSASTEVPRATTPPTRVTSPRPKDRPPPLPTTPPKGGVSTNKVPPLLPKTPPKGEAAIKPKPRKKSLKPAQSSIESSTSFDSIENATGTCSNSSNQTFPADVDNTKESACDTPQSVLPTTEKKTHYQTTCDNINTEEDFGFSNLKSKFVSSNVVITTKPAPKTPLKPKPRLSTKAKGDKTETVGLNKQNSQSEENLTKTTAVDAKESNISTANRKESEFFKDLKQKQLSFEKQEGEKETSVRFQNKLSPAQSPLASRKPLPKIPFKPPSNQPLNTENSNNDKQPSPKQSPRVAKKSPLKVPEKIKRDNSKKDKGEIDKLVNVAKSSPSQSPILPKKPLPKVPLKSKPFVNVTDSSVSSSSDSSGIQQIKKGVSSKISSNEGSPQSENVEKETGKSVTELKGTSCKPTPVPRPRPTPRKRLSLNRSSATEESLDKLLTPPNSELSDNTKGDLKSLIAKSRSEENVYNSSKESIVTSKSDELATDTGEGLKGQGGSHIKSLVKSRVVYSDKGEEKQYRVIDKTVVQIREHITDIDSGDRDSDTIVLRKKSTHISREIDEDTVPSIDELREIFKDDSDEDTDSSTNAQDNVPNVCDVKCENSSKVVDSLSGEKIIDANKTGSNISEGSSSGKDSFEDLLSDKSMLEPTSLLNEIEEILTRSYKYSSLTRSGSSPEKKCSPMLKDKLDVRYERSRSVDAYSEETPVRPPRPKKEQKRLRSQSQILYDSCGSDTESLPDISRTRADIRSSDLSLTLGPAKPHPPKPRRNKLLRVQRSQSDVTAMKSIVDKLDDTKSSSPKAFHHRQISDGGQSGMSDSSPSTPDGKGINTGRPMSWRKSRPARKAPPPPTIPPFKVTPPSPSVDINTVVPLDARVKSIHLDNSSPSRNSARNGVNHKGVVKDTAGSYYHSIKDGEMDDTSEEDDNDYHEIPEDLKKAGSSKTNSGMTKPNDSTSGRGKLRSPPKLPPRNLNSSQSFETSSLSSTGHEFDSALSGAAGSIDDLSISSGCIDTDLASPGFKHLQKFSQYPKTSSPNVKSGLKLENKMDENENIGLDRSSSSLSDNEDRQVSGLSLKSDSGSGSHLQEQDTSSESESEDEDKVDEVPQVCRFGKGAGTDLASKNREKSLLPPPAKTGRSFEKQGEITEKKRKKLRMIAGEITSSERVFVDVLRLLNVDFRKHISDATEHIGRPVIPSETLNRILDYLPQLQNFNEDLLKDLEARLNNWDGQQGVADIFVKKGPFLKLYSSYIRDFETMTSTLDDAVKKYPTFQTALKEFELSPRCSSLALKHYMLKPIQRIPQYKMLLSDYLKYLSPDSTEMKDMLTALAIVSEVANHANESMRHEDYVQKMLEIQRSLIGQFEVIKPGRFNDVLLYTTPVATGYRLNNILPLAGMKVSMSAQDEYKMEFSIISVQRSFTLHGTTLEERDDWITALNSAIDENALKRNTFEAVRAGTQFRESHLQSSWESYKVLLDKDFVLGHKAPLWIPDARVTMCMLCTMEFTVTWRRHHCRACGRVVCGNCSECKAPLRYLKYKPARVCEECYKTLEQDLDKEMTDSVIDKDDTESVKDEEDGFSLLNIKNGLFERFHKIRKSANKSDSKKLHIRPDRLKEVAANYEGASMSGYLHLLKGRKWKKHWYLIKEKVLYTFKATQDTAAADSMVLLGYEVSRFNEYFEGVEADLLFQLSHSGTDPIVFRTDSATATERWVTVMRESTVA